MSRVQIWVTLFYAFVLPILGIACMIFKRRWLFFKRLLIIALIPVTIKFSVIFISKLQSKPLYGHFKIGEDFICLCGHESFILIEKEHFYDCCPGHRDKYLCGKVARKKNIARLITKDGEIFCDLRWNGEKHYELHKGKRRYIEQVNNPWRTWLPWAESSDNEK